MKNFVKIMSLVLIVCTMFTLVACSSYGKVEKAFTSKGYTVSTEAKEVVNALKAELEQKDIAVEPHVLTKGFTIVAVVEFKATEQMVEFAQSSETAKGIIKDVANNEDAKAAHQALEDAGLANGNCLVLCFDLRPDVQKEVKDIVKNA